MRIVPFDASRVEALIEFFAQLPDRDLTFIKEDVSPGAVRREMAVQGVAHRDGTGRP